MAGLTSAEILDEAALLLNDSAKITFGYTVTAPWLKRAVNELSDELAVNSIPLLRKITSAPIAVGIGVTIIPMPADALLPILLEERAAGSADNWVEMSPLPAVTTSTTPGVSLNVWAFQGTLLNSVPVLDTPGASSAREVRVTYERFLSYAGIDGTTDFTAALTINSKRFLSSKVAEFVARFVLQNVPRAKELKDESGKSLYRLVQIWTKFRQRLPIRKSHFGSPNLDNILSIPVGGSSGSSPATTCPIPWINVKCAPYNAVGDGIVDDTAAFTSALAALPANGGLIMIPPGIYLIDNLNINKHNVILQGSGKESTRLKARVAGAGTTAGVITLNDVSRGRISDLTLDGNGLKLYCLGICPTNAGSGAGHWLFEDLIFYGATTDTIVIGNDTNSPDVASLIFLNCGAYGGAFGSVSPSNSQIAIHGSNTLLVTWMGGSIGGAVIPINIKMSNGEFSSYGSQGINSSSYHVEVGGGQFRSYNEHIEGTGGFMHTLGADPQGLVSAVSIVINGQMVNTGATTGNKCIFHESNRILSLHSTFFGGNVVIGGTGQVFTEGVVYGGGFGKLYSGTGGAGFYGVEHDGGLLLAKNIPLRSFSSDSAAWGSNFIDTLGRLEIVALSAADVNGPNRQSMIFIVADASFGGSAIVAYGGNNVPSILFQTAGAGFVVAAPAVGEIQLKTRGIGLGVAVRAGANRNNAKLAFAFMSAN